MSRFRELAPEELSNKIDCGFFEFETTADLDPLNGIIGQSRAAAAMEFGLAIKRPGYNIYVSGITGTGRSSYTRSIVSRVAANESVPDDWCYVYNFKNPDKPMCINLPAGMGYKLQRDMKRLLKDLKVKVPQAFEGEEYEKQKGQIIQEYQGKSSEYMESFNAFAREQGFIIRKSEHGLMTIPLRDGKPMEDKDYLEMPPEERKKIEDSSFMVQGKLMETLKRMKDIEKTAKDKIDQLETKIALLAVEQPIMELKEKYDKHKNIIEYLQAVQRDIIHNVEDFRNLESGKAEPLDLVGRIREKDFTIKYQVNLVVDNRDTKGAPVILESNPKYDNLLGKIEYESNMGVVTTDFTKIKAGSLHQANGGYIIINMSDLMRNPESWEGIKRSIKTGEITIENIFSMSGIVSGGIKPEPIPLNVKIILIGSSYVYQTLYTYDEDFRKLFKIKADFDTDMGSNKENCMKYASFIRSHCEKNGLMHFDRTAVAAVIEYSRRLAEHKHKLSTRFNDIIEVLYEADAWARIAGEQIVTGSNVKKAIEQKWYRSSRIEEKMQELIDTGVVLISTEEKVVGQVNGLSVMNFGDYTFGKPSRITAATYAGEKGIVNIEREVEMSGSIHDKGVLILTGYLGDKFAQEFPLTISASICFEQLYDGVEGDSASSTELYALLSSLSELPIKQYIAVTGSVNQKGEIQPIGGVNEKIEGFFQTCKTRGLKGNEGVMIPWQNVDNLMLKDEVIEAVREGKFHIYPVKTIDEGIEILTGTASGTRDESGNYPENTVFYLVQKKIEKFARIAEEFDDCEQERKA
ncbi:MAG TPA: ATP-binding protein [Bacillota bacterium]|nr:ATP-binding protein [Bacillota bacterium]HQI15515.1 ATP-binding protein [Bacillota bacterium]HQJ37118.1 ATP-binding protein [Bacillota bacterium]